MHPHDRSCSARIQDSGARRCAPFLSQNDYKLISVLVGLAACAHPGCGLTSNLWLCLVCGSLGCGRQQFGGGGGNGHGVEHTQTTGHSVAVKIGTIEPEGTAGAFAGVECVCGELTLSASDVYCYACDDAKLDPHLAKHLGNFGIEVAAQTKTEKSMTELVRPPLAAGA